jgi:hypothetical protein
MQAYLVYSVLIGAGATALMDIWALFLAWSFKIPAANWGLIGRWFCHLPEGRVFHEDIAAASCFPYERLVGWLAHYAIGIIYAGVLLLFTGLDWLKAPTFLPAWILGLVTVGAAWFLLQPGMGAGIAASKRPNATEIRFLNLLGHTVFAIGLYGSALLIR